MRLLIVEDEPAMAGILQFNFQSEGYDVKVVGDGFRAMELFQEAHAPQENANPPDAFDAIVLDLMLPGMSGYEICRRIREIDPHVPVLVLSARTLAEDRMLAFDAGTDQYLTKPFELAELLNRVRNLIERRRTKSSVEATPQEAAPNPSENADPPRYEFPNFTLDVKRYELKVGGETHDLTSRELELLKYFIDHEDEVLSRSRILQDVWDEPSDLTTRAIDNFVLRLRKYIEPDPANPRWILSVRGVGYRFVAPSDGESRETTKADEPEEAK